MVCGSPSSQPRVQGNNENVMVVDNIQYLGHPVSNNRQNPLVEETIKDFTCKVNGFSLYFDKVNCDVKSVLFKLYCTNLYCAQVCALCDGVIEIFNVAHRTALWRIGGPASGGGGGCKCPGGQSPVTARNTFWQTFRFLDNKPKLKRPCHV